MRSNPLQPTLDLFGPVRPPHRAAEAARYTPWPREERLEEVGRAVAEAVAAMLHLAEDRRTAEQLPRLLEIAVLASESGPGGVGLLAQVDEALSRARGRDHGLLDGRYS